MTEIRSLVQLRAKADKDLTQTLWDENLSPWWAVAAFEVLSYFKEAKLGTIRGQMRCNAYNDGSAILTCRRWPSLGGLHHA